MKGLAIQTTCVVLGAWLPLLATQAVSGQLIARDDTHTGYPIDSTVISGDEATVIDETAPMETPMQTELPLPEMTPIETPTDTEGPPPEPTAEETMPTESEVIEESGSEMAPHENTAYPEATATDETPEDYETYEEATPSTMPEFVSRILEAMDNYGGNGGGGDQVPPVTDEDAMDTPLYTTEAMYTRVTVPAYRLTRTTEAMVTEGAPEPDSTPVGTGGEYNTGRTKEITEPETTITTTVPGGETTTTTPTNTGGAVGSAALPFQAAGLVAAVVAWLHTV